LPHCIHFFEMADELEEKSSLFLVPLECLFLHLIPSRFLLRCESVFPPKCHVAVIHSPSDELVSLLCLRLGLDPFISNARY